jgi:hypothetical protein
MYPVRIMSNVTNYITTSHVIRASQTHLRVDKSTHANLVEVKNCSLRPYGKCAVVYRFKDIHPDPEIVDLIDSLGDLLDESWYGLCNLREKFEECEPMYIPEPTFSQRSYENPRGRGVKRRFSDIGLEVLCKHHVHKLDVGTAPILVTNSSDKEIQVSEEDFVHTTKEFNLKNDADEPFLQRCNLRGSSHTKNSLFEVFHDRKFRESETAVSGVTRETWIFPGNDHLLRHRPVLGTRAGVHPEVLLRLRDISRFTVNVASELNRRLPILTYNEFPMTRDRRRNTSRFRTGMLRAHSIVAAGNDVMSRTQVEEYVQFHLYHRSTVDNPFEPTERIRYFMVEPNEDNRRTRQFWQRLGISVPLPRVWFVRRPRMLTNSIQETPRRRIRNERS